VSFFEAMTWLFVKLSIRVVVFTAVFALAVRKSERITVGKKWAVPVVGLVFALLNAGLYWLLQPVVNIATFGVAWLLVPFALNGAFLWATNRLVRRLRVNGLEFHGSWVMVKLAVLLTAVHGLLYLALDAFVK